MKAYIKVMFGSSALLSIFLLVGCGAQQQEVSLVRSLTGDDYTGNKYYYGFGAAASRDPSNMHNEVKYDVLHTHDIFVEDIGGSYEGTKHIASQVNRYNIVNKWQQLRSTMTEDDMFIQYSSSHGSRSGLMVGVSYDEIRDNALSYPAKEIIIFTMACHSGALVDSFNRVRHRWENREDRTLLVMASSPASQTSSTGPGRDRDEPTGPYGSAGSAFGHALWKALIGYADGYVDGFKDGYLSLEEIIEYTKMRTQQVGRHTPQYTGVFNPHLLMNRVPPRSFVEALEHTTEHLSDDEIAERVAELDRSMRI